MLKRLSCWLAVLRTPDNDGGRSQVLSTDDDGRPSPVDHTQRPVLRTTRWAIGRDGTARSIGVS